MAGNGAYLVGLDRNRANYTPLTPLTFIERAAYVYPDRLSVVHGEQRYTWRETYARCRRLASALARRGIGKNDTVAVMAPNMPAMVEAAVRRADVRRGAEHAEHAARCGNDRLHAAAWRGAGTDHRSGVLRHDRGGAGAAGRTAAGDRHRRSQFRRRRDCWARSTTRRSWRGAIPDYAWQGPADEWDAIALNYTSGTTGDPKGVVYHHRGAYLNAISNMLDWGMPQHAVYLWTLPMFHCNGWCFPWTVAERAGTNVCLRRVEAKAALDAIREHGVTHMCGAPIVYSMLINAPEELRRGHQPQDRRADRGRRAAGGDYRRRRERSASN